MLPADIVLQNDSKSTVTLVHTSACLPGDNFAYQGRTTYWKNAPPDVGLQIEPGKCATIGTMNTVIWFDSPSWIYLQYDTKPSARLQVFVDMKGPSGGIWTHIDPYDPLATESCPVPKDDRIELVSYNFETRPNWTVTVHVPMQETWDYNKAIESKDTGSSSWISGFLNAALSTLITVCFVIPPAAPIGAAAATISTAGKAAIALTAAQGILGVATSHGSAYRPAAFGANDAYASVKSALNGERVKKLKDAMDDVQSRYAHSNDTGGMMNKLTSISAKVKAQLAQRSTIDFSDPTLKADTAQYLALLNQITNADGPFQVALVACLNVRPSDSVVGTPPDSVQISLAIAGLCMVFNALADGYAIRTYIQASDDAEALRQEFKVDCYDADNIYEYLSGKLDMLEKLDILSPATAYRLSLLHFDIESESVGLDYPVVYFYVTVRDKGIAAASWGPASVKDADTHMSQIGMTPVEPFVDGGERVWRDMDSLHNGPCDLDRSDRAYIIHKSYGAFLSNLVANDVKNVLTQPMEDIKEAMVLYIAKLRTPLAPFDAPEIKLGGLQPVPPELPKINLIQYGYVFVNDQKTESSITWAKPIGILAQGSQDATWYTSAEVRASKDPNNARARTLADKAKARSQGDTAYKVTPVTQGSITQPLETTPPYTSSMRRIYRRFWASQEEVLTDSPSVPALVVKGLTRSDEDTFTDTWDLDAMKSAGPS